MSGFACLGGGKTRSWRVIGKAPDSGVRRAPRRASLLDNSFFIQPPAANQDHYPRTPPLADAPPLPGIPIGGGLTYTAREPMVTPEPLHYPIKSGIEICSGSPSSLAFFLSCSRVPSLDSRLLLVFLRSRTHARWGRTAIGHPTISGGRQ